MWMGDDLADDTWVQEDFEGGEDEVEVEQSRRRLQEVVEVEHEQ